MLVRGDKLIVTKDIAGCLNKGDIAKVIEVKEKGIVFAFGKDFVHMGFMTPDECEEYFKKEEVVNNNKAPSITSEHIEKIMKDSEIEAFTAFDKCTIVACRLPNGFVIVESSACVSPENYNEEMGINACLDRIENKVWELEGYNLQEKLHRENYCEDYDECECHYCDSSSCDHSCLEDRDTEFEYDDDDSDCFDCDDLDCPHNPNR